jgi:hypothetical protein
VADELVLVDTWLYNVLHGDSALLAAAPGDVHADLAPSGTDDPYVVYQWQGGDDTIGATEANRIMHRGIWVVKAIAQTTKYTGPLKTIADRIDTLLHASAGGVVTGGVVFTSYRIQPFRMTEERDGQQYRHLGGQYRVLVQAA